MDTALRRRFAFIELMPDVAPLAGATVNELALDDFLLALNKRVARTEGREKQLGHALLMDDGEAIADSAEFARRFRQEILPLLQEYCYDNYDLLADYIGTRLVDSGAGQLNSDILDDDDALIAALATLTASDNATD
jgi:5-methylcytosine-specific restriction protein B